MNAKPQAGVVVKKVRDVMTPNPICVTGSTELPELGEIFDSNGISGVPVLDDQDRVIGVVSKTDLVQRCVDGPLGSTPGSSLSAYEGLARGTGGTLDPDEYGRVEDFMTTDPVTAGPDESLGAIARRMSEERVHRIVVVDEKRRAIGIVTTLDVLDHFPAE